MRLYAPTTKPLGRIDEPHIEERLVGALRRVALRFLEQAAMGSERGSAAARCSISSSNRSLAARPSSWRVQCSPPSSLCRIDAVVADRPARSRRRRSSTAVRSGAHRHERLRPARAASRARCSTWPRWPTATSRVARLRDRPEHAAPRAARAARACRASTKAPAAARGGSERGGRAGQRRWASRLHRSSRSAHARARQGIGRPRAFGGSSVMYFSPLCGAQQAADVVARRELKS